MAEYKYYQDPFDRERNLRWHRQRSQANFRGEDWALSFEDFCKIWDRRHWDRRGRGIDDLCMTRYPDYEGPWHPDNVVLVTRRVFISVKNKRMWGQPWEYLLKDAIRV